MVNLRETLQEAHAILEKNQIAHALIGGFALASHGYFRATADIDFLADGTKAILIKRALAERGFALIFESKEVLQFSGRGMVDIILANRPLSQEMLKQAQFDKSLQVHILRAEDLIGLKIQAYKNDSSRELQDKADIQNLLLKPNLDLTLVQKYADLFSEWPEIEKLMKVRSS